MLRRLYIVLPVICLLCACSSSVREAQQTIALADSLRVNEGITCDDSLALAEAYSTLGHWRLIYPNAYARVCYYYGRMLRYRNDQVAAMRAFISGTHAPYVQRVVPLLWFNDYHILGRIYSNIGTMCHLAGEFELSYDMYERTAACMFQTNDSILYYYALNEMAVELAEQNLHAETLSILKRIETECTDTNVLTKIWETKAILYRNLAMSDSAIYAAKQLYSRSYYTGTTGLVIEAQSFWQIEQYDSALYYAKIVMDHPYASDQDKYHMLYILMKHDSSTAKEDVQALSSARADLDAEVIEPLLQQLSAAVEVLRQNLDKKPHYMYLCFILASICLIVGVAWAAKNRIKKFTIIEHKKHQQLSKRNTEIRADIEQLQTSNEVLRQENSDLLIQHSAHREKYIQEIEQCSIALRSSTDWEKELSWKQHDKLCELADKNFYLLASKLRAKGFLNEREIHLCILVVIGGFTDKQLAKLLSYGDNSIRSIKRYTAKKLGTTGACLRDFLIEQVIGTINSVK